MKILNRQEIETVLPGIDLLPIIESGFVAYSSGQTVVPPVGELNLDKGEVHIKYGLIKSQPYYVIKIASGFYDNSQLGLSNSGGCMLVFSQLTGQLMGILLDEGHLTDVRTAVAGAIAAKHLAPKEVTKIGIIGTGIQARAQLQHLAGITECRSVLAWGRSAEKLDEFVKWFARNHSSLGFDIETTPDARRILPECNLIVTTTPARQPLLFADQLAPGTHITAVGSDMPDKQELDSRILQIADVVVADSISQCKLRGEISQALRNDFIDSKQIVELGNVISGVVPGRANDEQISIVDLTGVAVQDIQIATAVLGQFDPAQ